ncbi:putative serine/threonine-protein kinase bri1 [Corchorus olitorius]|uniref:Serine/threonine-protein kinase bri1 n=1 Tax=Corchorus olitorius TaxID=93759 RepID=A0A1R3J074_9ROSI|nr:putative serine/threonine-protein kinase bri1 [Corchorus olitorius]
MTLLNHLNLSYNNLSGHIPSSNQLQTVADPSSYKGNQRLCGPPLLNNYSSSSDGNGVSKDKASDEDEESSQMLWIYISAALGFVFGFWAIFGTLVVKKSVRHAYFKYLDEIADKIAVQLVVNVARLKRKIRFERIQTQL